MLQIREERRDFMQVLSVLDPCNARICLRRSFGDAFGDAFAFSPLRLCAKAGSKIALIFHPDKILSSRLRRISVKRFCSSLSCICNRGLMYVTSSDEMAEFGSWRTTGREASATSVSSVPKVELDKSMWYWLPTGTSYRRTG